MSCEHENMIKITEPTTHECETCVQLGDEWVHLRMCMPENTI